MRAPIGIASPSDAVRVATAVPILMVMADDRHDRIREVDRRKNLGADRRMELHLLEFGRRELAGLVQDVLGDGDLAGIVQQRRRFDRLEQRFVGDLEFARERHRGDLDAADVAVRDFVLGIDGGCERLDGRQIEAVERGDMPLGVFRAPERRLQGEVEDDQHRRDEQERRQAGRSAAGGARWRPGNATHAPAA